MGKYEGIGPQGLDNLRINWHEYHLEEEREEWVSRHSGTYIYKGVINHFEKDNTNQMRTTSVH